MLSVFGVYPWRCQNCHTRFHSRMLPLGEALRAHCPICGNQDLKRIAPEHVNTPLAFVWRKLGIPAYRCEPCRYKYFSMRLRRADKRAEVGELTSAD